jgi:5-methylthioribose kinase
MRHIFPLDLSRWERDVSFNIPLNYQPLSASTLPDYLAAVPVLRERLGGGPKDWTLREASDGYLNLVYLVNGPEGSLCTKQSLPHVREDKDWPLPLDRTASEHLYWRTIGPHAPGLIPEVHHYDPELSLLAMEQLHPHQVLRGRIVAGEIYPGMSRRVAEFVARSTFFTSDFHQKQEFKHERIAELKANHVLHRIMLELVYQDPFMPSERNHWTTPHLDAFVEDFRTNGRIRAAAGRLGHKYLTTPQALIHNDLHAGAVMLTDDDLRIIDPEFATFGPIGVDLGIFIGHLLIGYFAQDGHATESDNRDRQQRWLLDEIASFWFAFRERFLQLWRDHAAGDAYLAKGFDDLVGRAVAESERARFVDMLFADAIGFAAAAMIRSIIGYSHFAEMETIADPDRKGAAEAGALSLARTFLLEPEQFATIADVIDEAPRRRRAPGSRFTPN